MDINHYEVMGDFWKFFHQNHQNQLILVLFLDPISPPQFQNVYETWEPVLRWLEFLQWSANCLKGIIIFWRRGFAWSSMRTNGKFLVLLYGWYYVMSILRLAWMKNVYDFNFRSKIHAPPQLKVPSNKKKLKWNW